MLYRAHTDKGYRAHTDKGYRAHTDKCYTEHTQIKATEHTQIKATEHTQIKATENTLTPSDQSIGSNPPPSTSPEHNHKKIVEEYSLTEHPAERGQEEIVEKGSH